MSSSQHVAIVPQVGAIYGMAVLFNYLWELAQARLYVGMDGAQIASWLCYLASVADGLLVVLIFALGWITFGRWDWFKKPGVRGYLLTLATGLAIAVSAEWVTVYGLRWWSYSPLMPLLPGLRVGLAPVAQMLVLPSLVFRVAAMWRACAR